MERERGRMERIRELYRTEKRGTRRGWTFGRRRRAKPEGISGIRDRHFKEQLRLGSERISGGIYRKALVLEIVKRIARSSVTIIKMRDWTSWRGRFPLKRKKRLLAA
jgi:hypothetical protein